jgi:hypothetical protein
MDTRQEQAGTRESAGFTIAFVAAATAAAAFGRLVPYLLDMGTQAKYAWNLAAVGALGLFAGARLRSRWALLVPVLAMLASDLLLIKPLAAKGLAAFDWGRPFIYASFAAYAALGLAARRVAWPLSVIPGCLLGSVQFFLVSNFLVWLGGDGTLYAHTLGGLVQCYVEGLPFFWNTAGGDLLYTGLFFGLHAALQRALLRQKVSQPA